MQLNHCLSQPTEITERFSWLEPFPMWFICISMQFTVHLFHLWQTVQRKVSYWRSLGSLADGSEKTLLPSFVSYISNSIISLTGDPRVWPSSKSSTTVHLLSIFQRPDWNSLRQSTPSPAAWLTSPPPSPDPFSCGCTDQRRDSLTILTTVDLVSKTEVTCTE